MILMHVGETWNFMKMGYQLKQVRERIQKGLVDKVCFPILRRILLHMLA